jgi:hypothetical protein
MDMPPHARAVAFGRGHHFAAYPRCSADTREEARTDGGEARAMIHSWLRRLRGRGLARRQHRTCARVGAICTPPGAGSKVGIALQTRGRQPLNALRHQPAGGTCGWYLWWGDEIDQGDDDFFQPLHVEHLEQYCPDALPYMWLPPGWRIQLAPGQENVWFDDTVLDVNK